MYILDYSRGKVCKINYVPKAIVETEDENILDDFLNKFGLSTDECSWMFSDHDFTYIQPLEVL